MAALKIGFIGVGGIASFYADGLKKIPDAEIWSICDSSPEPLERRRVEWGLPAARVYEEPEAMLRDPELDAVMIGTPNESHYGLAKLAIASGKPFALEKPVAMDAAEAAELAQLLKASPIPHLICFSYRYKKAARYARQLIKEGRLGKILHVHSQYMQGWAMDERIPLVWRFRKEKTGSGAIGDLGSHILDLTRFLIGDTERVVADAGTIVPQRDLLDGSGQGEVDVDDFCHVLSRLEGGISSTMAISRFASGRGNYQRIEIFGTQGALVYRLEEDDTLRIRLDGDEAFRAVDIPEAFHADQMRSFVQLLQGGGDGLDATIEDGLANQRAVDAIVESFEQQRWIAIE
ncbi:Gfo/Idh/MocA family protein [Paenibacillus sp. B01]|uniref:Gfo/Idh/MocA family protein n=1 Tax=Paenibacillus sp. B01 TaxID=2660554 RepID=UPI00129B709B|nr:Gfo/Idh/MocA family oxidoreductase [Paenibacillus sp. B01]QGG54870.1 gfo/Idh/MocA family oxidoreductase [Paenibacillus sp. B01]